MYSESGDMGTGNKTIRKRRHGTQEIDDMGEGKVTRNRRQVKRKRGREIEYGAEHREERDGIHGKRKKDRRREAGNTERWTWSRWSRTGDSGHKGRV